MQKQHKCAGLCLEGQKGARDPIIMSLATVVVDARENSAD